MTVLAEERGFESSGDGYDYIGVAREEGWAEVPGWGLDGWDLGDWPYVILFIRHEGERWGVRTRCEGDLTTRWFATKAEALHDMDVQAHWYWTHGSSVGPDSPSLENPDHCGPFSWGRLALRGHPEHESDGLRGSCPACRG